MSETLILILGHEPEAPVRWAFVKDAEIATTGAGGSAADLHAITERAAAARMCIAVLPGEQVAMRAIPSPPKNAAKFRAAAAYLLEDELAENLDTLHIATAYRDGAGQALAVKKSIVDNWQDAFAEAGLTPDILTADFSLLPVSPDTAFFVFESLRIVGVGGGEGFAAERPLADALAKSISTNDQITRIVAYSDGGDEALDFAGKEAEWRRADGPVSLFAILEKITEQDRIPNFLHGAYRRKMNWRGAVGAWRRTGAFAAACLVALVAVTIADGVRSTRLAAAFEDKAAEVHLAAFPDASGVEPVAHARQILSTQAEGPAFLQLSAEFARSLENAGDIQVDRLRYNAARNEFSANLRFGDINDLEAFKKALAARGVIATESGDVRRSGGHYIGELQVTAS